VVVSEVAVIGRYVWYWNCPTTISES